MVEAVDGGDGVMLKRHSLIIDLLLLFYLIDYYGQLRGSYHGKKEKKKSGNGRKWTY